MKGGGTNSNESPQHAFDGNKRSKWFHNGAKKTWIQCQFPKKQKKAFSGYAITSGNDCPDRDPMDWRIEGSDDGKKWVLLDQRSGEKFSGRQKTSKFTIKEPKPFNIYRISIDKSKAGNDGIQLCEIELTGEVKK